MNDIFILALSTFIWFFLRTAQTLLIVFTKNKLQKYILVSIVAFITSVVWVILIRKVAIGDDLLSLLVYSLISVIGINAGMFVNDKYNIKN